MSAAPFVGRESELGRVRSLIADRRLVTIVGPGGIGKSSFAEHFARDAEPNFSGVFFVRLANVDDAALVAQAIADAVGVERVGNERIDDTLVEALARERVLLVLDDAHHVAAGVAALLRRLFAANRRLRVLVTSRAPLGTNDESVVSLGPLDAGVELFLAREAAVEPKVERAQAAPVRALCRTLEGVPLAIELAAGQGGNLERLTAFLTTRTVAADAQRFPVVDYVWPIRAMLDWSFESLAPAERQLFARLGIFDGSFTLEACSQIAYHRSPGEDLRPALDTLLRKALVKRGGSDEEPRFSLHAVVAAYARERLREVDRAGLTERRYCGYYAALARFLDDAAETEKPQLFARIARDRDNLIGALRWLLERKLDVRSGCSMTVSLWTYWHELDRHREAQHWIDLALESCDRSGEVRGELLRACAILAFDRGDFAATAAVGKLLVEHAGRGGDTGELGRALVVLATAKYELGREADAEADFLRALECFRAERQPRRVATTLETLALLAAEQRGDYADARAKLVEARALLEESGPSRYLATVVANLGYLSFLEGDLTQAMALAHEGLAAFERLGVPSHVAWQLISMAGYELAAGEYAAALDSLRRARVAMEQQPDRSNRGQYFEIAFRLAVAMGAYEPAARIDGYLERFRAATHTRRSPSERAAYARSRAKLEAEVEGGNLERLREAGASLDPQALESEVRALSQRLRLT